MLWVSKLIYPFVILYQKTSKKEEAVRQHPAIEHRDLAEEAAHCSSWSPNGELSV